VRAIVYTHYGPPDVLELRELDAPSPRDDEILIRVHAAEATKADCEMRSFNFPVKWFWLPLRIAFGFRKPKRQILGGYFSGEVESAGKDVSRFRAGEQVFGSTGLRFGAYGEYMCLPARYTIVTKPANMSHVQAAAVPLGSLNALHFLRRLNIQPGENILINGAGGSIGAFAVQIAKTMGAHVSAVDSGMKEDMVRSIGADHFIDYTREDFTASGQSWDMIFDMVAGSSYSKCIGALKPYGRYAKGNPRLSDMFRSILTTRLSNKTAIFAFARESEEELITIRNMIEAGKIRSVVDRVYPLEQAADAHRRVQTEQRVGMVVIAVAGDAHPDSGTG
jgi:NADPH:quinone reductase-like Zn-dependent oxidoreductase